MTPGTARAILTGLRNSREQIDGLIEGIATMVLGIRGLEDSWVYQDIFNKGRDQCLAEGRARGIAEGEGRAEGRAQAARKILLRLGRKRLGQPDEQALTRMLDLTDPECLNLVLERLLEASSWDELLAPWGA